MSGDLAINLPTGSIKRTIERKLRARLRTQRFFMKNNEQRIPFQELPPEPLRSPVGLDAEIDPLLDDPPRTPSPSPKPTQPEP